MDMHARSDGEDKVTLDGPLQTFYLLLLTNLVYTYIYSIYISFKLSLALIDFCLLVLFYIVLIF